MIEPSQFQVNDAWIAFKLNGNPVVTEADGDFNVFALMDAASCFVLGFEFVPANSEEPSQLESKRLLAGGTSHKQQLPGKLIIPANLAADILSAEAKRQGVNVVRVPEGDLAIFIQEAREGFEKHVSGGRLQ